MKIELDELTKKYESVSGKFESNYFNKYDIEWLDNVPSTMTIVDENIKKNIFNKIIVANHQDKGQGRFGRQWESPIGKNLLLSLPVEIDSQNLNRIPIISTVSVLNAIKFFLKDKENISIKWPNDILVKEKVIVVRTGKGRKDRKSILSNKFIEHFKGINNHDNYLFSGRNGHLTTRSVQQIIKQAAKKAKINKRVYPHLIRHAFATHLFNNNTKTEYIQRLLGHKDKKTTERYIAIHDKDVVNVKSPHD